MTALVVTRWRSANKNDSVPDRRTGLHKIRNATRPHIKEHAFDCVGAEFMQMCVNEHC